VGCEPLYRDPAPSAILRSMPGMVHSPLRIARPAVRAGWLKNRSASDRLARGTDAFIEVDWDTALSLVAEEIARIRAERGADGILGGSYGWSSAGRLHHARTLVQRFLNASGGCVLQAGNYSWGAAQFLLPHVIGSYQPVTGRVTDWRSMLAHTELFIAFGGLPLRNLQVSSGGTAIHASANFIEQAARSRMRFVMVSPTRADIPEPLRDRARWVAIRPNTDTALMLGMAHTLLAEGLADAEFLATHCTGFEQFSAYLLGQTDGLAKTAAWAESVCGVPAALIESLAREAAAHRTMLNCTWSLQRAHRGEQPYWASIALASMLGQIGLPGGGFAFGHGSISGAGSPRRDLPIPEMPALGNPESQSIPVARVADMLLNPGSSYEFNGQMRYFPDIDLIYWAGGNPFHHHQDLNRLVRAWEKPSTIVVHDSWWTPVAKRADIVLPATLTLERNDIGASSRDRFVLAMKRALLPHVASRNDFDIFSDLAARLGCEELFTEGRDELAWIRHLYAVAAKKSAEGGYAWPEFGEFWERGLIEFPEPERDHVLFEAFRQDPVKFPLGTPSGRIEIFSQTIASMGYDDVPPHPAWLPPREWLGAALASRLPLHLISSQPPDKLHSQLDAGELSRAGKIKDRQVVRMSPEDAADRGIADGDLVCVFNDRGQCLGAACIDREVMSGVVIMSTGAWFDPDGSNLERHGNPNVLTADIGTSRLTQACSAMSALVDVRAWQGPVPPVRAFELPAGLAHSGHDQH
jgi:biotin/methionine sulfoxide reductase